MRGRVLFTRRAAIIAVVGLSGLMAAGCGELSSPTTYPLRGMIQIPGGDVANLAGAHVEAVVASDRRIEARGEIQRDGTFVLQTVHRGQLLEGVCQGEYLVRIVQEDDDRGGRRRRPALASRFAHYEKSGLGFQTPGTEFVTLQVSSR